MAKVCKIAIDKHDFQNLAKWAAVSGRTPEHELALLFAAERVRRKAGRDAPARD